MRKLLLKLKDKNPAAYEQVKKLKFTEQRKLFLEPILNALGLGSIANAFGPLGTTLVGLGGVAAGVGIGAIAGRASQNNEIRKLHEEKNKYDSELLMVEGQRDSARAKFEYKLNELENQLADLSQSGDSGVNLISLWVDSHTFI